MNKYHMNIIFALLTFLCLAVYADPMPVIIMDSSGWKGCFKYQMHGFSSFNSGLWQQGTPNPGSKNFNYSTSDKDFVPNISNKGVNHLGCILYDSGNYTLAADTYTFKTDTYVSSVTDLNIPYSTLMYKNLTPFTQSTTLGETISIGISGSISVTRGQSLALSLANTGINTYSYSGHLSDLLSVGLAITQALEIGIAGEMSLSNTLTLTINETRTKTNDEMPPGYATAFHLDVQGYVRPHQVLYYDDIVSGVSHTDLLRNVRIDHVYALCTVMRVENIKVRSLF